MARSLWKGPFVDNFLLQKSTFSIQKSRNQIENILSSKKQKISGVSKNPLRIWSRRSTILPEFIDQFFEIHNGKQFIQLQVNEDMIGHKFGEFASTRKKTLHKKKVKGKA